MKIIMSETETSLGTKYLVLKLSKEVDLTTLLKKLKNYQKEHKTKPTWNDLADLLAKSEIDPKQTKIHEFIEIK
jgi:hypothetical protein